MELENIKLKKITRKEIKKIFNMVKKIGITEVLNLDVKKRDEKAFEFIKNIILTVDDIDNDIDDLLTGLTNITKEEAQELSVDDIFEIFKKVFKENKITSFLKLGSF